MKRPKEISTVSTTARRVRVPVCIIGAGATGLSLARLLNATGVECLVFDRGLPGYGATFNSAGVLHSGARYAISDPHLTKICRVAHQQLQLHAPFSIVNRSDAYYVVTDDSGEQYAAQLASACSEARLELRQVPREAVLESEPNLCKQVRFALAVPDWVIDPMLLLAAYLESLLADGVSVLPESRLLEVSHRRGVWSVELCRTCAAERTIVKCEVVVVAAGAWSAEALGAFGIELSLQYVNGSMFVDGCTVVEASFWAVFLYHPRPPQAQT